MVKFDKSKIEKSLVWLILSGTALFFGFLTIPEWLKALDIDKWVETPCTVIESRVEEEGSSDWADLFVVRYQYQWDSETLESNCYRVEYDGGSYETEPNELTASYPTGSIVPCYVNPENPTQAVLEKESVYAIFSLFLPLALLIVSISNLITIWHPATVARLQESPQTTSGFFLRFLWKLIKWGAYVIGFLLFAAVGIWGIVGLGLVLFLFFGFPYLAGTTFWEQLKSVGNELTKIDLEKGTIGNISSRKTKLYWWEIGIILLAVIAFIWVMSFYLKYNAEFELWSIFGIIFTSIWFGGVFLILTAALLIGIRTFLQKRKVLNKKINTSVKIGSSFSIMGAVKLAVGILCFIGFAGFLAGFVCVFLTLSVKPMVFTRARFPLGALESVAVDHEDNIYCAISFYGRVQVYSPEGEFLRGWFLDAGGGVFRIKIDSENNLHVVTARGDHHYVFSTEGTLLSSSQVSPKEEDRLFGEKWRPAVYDRDGNSYNIHSPILFSRISKETPSGLQTTVVSDPFVLWFVKGPMPAWLWIPISFVLFWRIEKIEKRTKQRLRQDRNMKNMWDMYGDKWNALK